MLYLNNPHTSSRAICHTKRETSFSLIQYIIHTTYLSDYIRVIKASGQPYYPRLPDSFWAFDRGLRGHASASQRSPALPGGRSDAEIP